MPPCCSGPSPATLGPQLGEEGGQRKDKVSPRLSSARSPVASPTLRVWLPGRRAPGAVCNSSRPPPLTRSSSSPAPARVQALNTPLQTVTAAATAAGSRGCPFFLRGPRLAAPGSPGGKQRRASLAPLSLLASRRCSCPETRVCAGPILHALRTGRLGSPGKECVIAVKAHSGGRRDSEQKPPRRRNATITVKTNPRPLSPPARLGEAAGRRSSPGWRRRPLAGHPTPVGYTQQEPGVGRGQGGASRGWANHAHSCPAGQRAAPMGGRHPSSSHYHPVHVFHSTQWPQRNGPVRRTSQTERDSVGNGGIGLTRERK